MRPSGEKRSDVGSVNPLKTISSWNPDGSVAASTKRVAPNNMTNASSAVIVRGAPSRRNGTVSENDLPEPSFDDFLAPPDPLHAALAGDPSLGLAGFP
jgi:hypothetical protein